MGNKLFVGNLGDGVDGAALRELFAAHGTVLSAQVVSDRITGQSKGFGFVQMGTDAEAQAAVAAVHRRKFSGRVLSVNIATPFEERSRASRGRNPSRGGMAGHSRRND